ncbi:hypothetical protein BY996DRAFT_6571684 [Phakopsora pachyrhizi]|nr:hypothetical protein BY996DRAFT_6571684 [Phakopsora pachyrhizi]
MLGFPMDRILEGPMDGDLLKLREETGVGSVDQQNNSEMWRLFPTGRLDSIELSALNSQALIKHEEA